MFLALYVDDILLAKNDLEMIESIKQWLPFVFEMNDMSEIRNTLDVKTVTNHPKVYINSS